jgi:DNA polymerase III sliding clamp (beta) subunit (PCNA family)
MKLPKNCLVEKVASQDATRAAITLPYLDIDGQRTAHVVATNGAAMVKLPVEITAEDVAGYVPTAALKEGRKLAKRTDSVDLVCNGSAKLLNGATYPRESRETFPPWRQVWPKEEGKITLALDARLLYELAQAMGTEGVVLTFNPGEPISVRATATKACQPASFDARGILMPIRIKPAS